MRRRLFVIVASAMLIAILAWVTRIVEMPLRTTSADNPDIGRSLVLRTDYDDDAAWQSMVAAIEAAAGEFRAFMRFIDDPAHAAMTPERIVEFARRDQRTFIFVVDRQALTMPGRPILVVDTSDQPGRSFRVMPADIWGVENNLALANMDFEEFATAAGADGVFRGFRSR